MSAPDLHQMADIALRISRASLMKTKAGGIVFVLGYADGTTMQLPFPEECGELMNVAEARDRNGKAEQEKNDDR